MFMREHPFCRIPDGKLHLFVVPVGCLFLVLLVVIVEIVQLGPGWARFSELALAFSSGRATEALATWTVEDRVRIAFVNGLDYLFGPVYANLLALGCVWAGRSSGDRERRIGSFFAWVAWAVWLLDIPENVAYLNLVGGDVGQPWPFVFGSCVLLRTALVVGALAFLARSLVRRRALSDRSG